jgi:predicted enzyme related to lactoylglutathione lyase
MLPWLHVDDMVQAMKLVRTHGGEVLEHPTPDGPDRLLATVRDPAGNVVGLVQLVAR